VSNRHRHAALVALVAWAALLLQYALLLVATHDGIGFWLGTLRYFSFFTILGNIAVALTTTTAAVGGIGARGFFGSARVRGGVALCIALVGVVYHVLLAATWSPQGLQRVVDILLHYAVPLLYLGWWLAAVPHGRLAWRDPLRWLLFPAVFLCGCLVRGAWLHEYPYPFIDVDALGYAAVLRNALAIAVLFLAGGLALVALDRVLGQHGAAGRAP